MSGARREVRQTLEIVAHVDVVTCDACGQEATGAPRAGVSPEKFPDVAMWGRFALLADCEEPYAASPAFAMDLCRSCAAVVADYVKQYVERMRIARSH